MAMGKWHLGLGNGNVDWNGDINPGPLEIGFDERRGGWRKSGEADGG